MAHRWIACIAVYALAATALAAGAPSGQGPSGSGGAAPLPVRHHSGRGAAAAATAAAAAAAAGAALAVSGHNAALPPAQAGLPERRQLGEAQLLPFLLGGGAPPAANAAANAAAAAPAPPPPPSPPTPAPFLAPVIASTRSPRPPGSVTKQLVIPKSTAAQSALERARELVSRMTLQEKLTQLHNRHAEVPRLGLPAYDFLNECLHGYWEPDGGALAPTLFPQPLVMASSFDRDLVFRVFDAISDEMRAKSNDAAARGRGATALTCWTPHMNILRDPRWGRASETWGEDPHLTAVMAAHVVRGLQGSDPTFLKVAATCKHFLGYSFEMAEGHSRYSFNANISAQDLADTYLPAFDACVRAARTAGIMCAYNAVDGTPMCSNSDKLQSLLRDKWRFDGYVVSDCNAVMAFKWGHRTADSWPHALAQALKAGTDILCDNMPTRQAAADAIAQGLLTERDIDAALARTFAVRFRTGQFDAPEALPWGAFDLSKVNSAGHKALAKEAAHKGIVLLKNQPFMASDARGGRSSPDKPLLPLDKSRLRRVCVVGPLADSAEHMMGNYYGAWDKKSPSPLKAIRTELSAGAKVEVRTDDAMKLMAANYYDWPLESALEACRDVDAAIIVVGQSMISNSGTGNDAPAWKPVSEGEGIDRETLSLPGRQLDLVKAVAMRNGNVPIVLVAMAGGPVDLAWAEASPNVAAIVAAGFPGQEGGRALSDILFGKVSPSGRLPNTWYHANYTSAVSLLDMNMRPDASRRYPGRTYRFLADPTYVQYPFGHGLSYTTFSYSGLTVASTQPTGGECAGYAGAAFCVSVTVTNSGPVAGDEVVLLYLSNTQRAGSEGIPLKSLRGFARTGPLAPGASAALQFPLGTSDFTVPSPSGQQLVRLGRWTARVGPLTADIDASRRRVDPKIKTHDWPARGPARREARRGA